MYSLVRSKLQSPSLGGLETHISVSEFLPEKEKLVGFVGGFLGSVGDE